MPSQAPKVKNAHSLANEAMRNSSDFYMGPWFLEALSGPERVLAFIQM